MSNISTDQLLVIGDYNYKENDWNNMTLLSRHGDVSLLCGQSSRSISRTTDYRSN